jgi:hypothetical protein
MSSETPNDGFGDDPVEFIETAEEIALSEADLELLAGAESDAPAVETEYHPVLKVWEHLLRDSDTPGNRHMTPRWAMSIVTQYHGVGFNDLRRYVDEYFVMVKAMYSILETEIASDEDCLKPSTAAEDVEHNRGHYLNVLRDWQLFLLTRELRWDPSKPSAGVELAALSEIQKLFFGETGLTGHLEAIKLDVTEEDQEALAAALQERSAELMGAK